MERRFGSLRGALRVSLLLASAFAAAGCATSGTGASSKDTLVKVSLDQQQTGSAVRLARAARAANDYASAINLYREVLTEPGRDPSIEVELGDTLVAAGALDDAIGVYSRVATTSPARLAALLGLQRVYLQLSDFATALTYANEARRIAPADSRVLIAHGMVLDMLRRHQEAQQAYRLVLVTDPRSIAARNNLALSLALTQQYEEAIEILKPIARSSNASPRLRQNLALIYGLMGDAKTAAELSAVDLDQVAVESNLGFFSFVGGKDKN